ncbi:MAG: trimethylamine methyltransferase family protein [Candidatus Aminicenantes bacterium]|nr:trimethylamine methyltransferase family protein [Candidatus Aminicenantes bacterium]
MTVRPKTKFLNRELIEKILSEAEEILCKLGVTILNKEILSLLADSGAKIDLEKSHALLTPDIIQQALKTVPSSFKLFDVTGNLTHEFSADNIYFTPASSALNVLDGETGRVRRPTSADYIDYTKVTAGLPHIVSQSTAFIPTDVDEKISDSYRLYLSLLYGEKPVVTGTFSSEAFPVMKEMQQAVRGTEAALKEKPLTIFSCCSTSPLKWGDVISQNIVECARSGIPVELISVPIPGFIAPVTLVGSLVEHTVEILSGIVIGQLSAPGAPMLYGGAPAPFDVRYETTPMSAIEAAMLCCSYNEIGKHLNIPTQAYISLSDAKSLDAQAGLETSMGAVLAALSGINNIAGPGVLDFVNSFSIEKLVLDNEICGMMLRMVKGVEAREDFPALPHFQEILKENHCIISKHTRRYLRREHYFPGSVIDRTNLQRWQEEGSQSLSERARQEVARLISEYEPSSLPVEVKSRLTEIMEQAAKGCGMDRLPNGEGSQ